MQLFYRQYGCGKPIIILHGLYGMSDNWVTIAKKLSKNFSVYIPDLRNHGQSPHSNDFNYNVMTMDILSFIKKLNINKPIILGHSMGGKVAMKIVLENPKLFEKLIVVDISPKTYTTRFIHLALLEAMLLTNVQNFTTLKEIDQSLRQRIKEPRLRMFLLKNIKWNIEGKAEWKINLIAIKSNIQIMHQGFEEYNCVDTETLFIKGGDSEYISENDFALIHHLFKNSSIETLQHTGHWLHSEQPESFLKIIESFIL